MASLDYLLNEIAAKCGSLSGDGDPNGSVQASVLAAPRGKTFYEQLDTLPAELWFLTTAGVWVRVSAAGTPIPDGALLFDDGGPLLFDDGDFMIVP